MRVFALIVLCMLGFSQTNEETLSLVRKGEIVPYQGFLLNSSTFKVYQFRYEAFSVLSDRVSVLSNTLDLSEKKIEKLNLKIGWFEDITNYQQGRINILTSESSRNEKVILNRKIENGLYLLLGAALAYASIYGAHLIYAPITTTF